MKFSIIVPVYNTEKYLKECIESILLQTFDDYELILINDGSTDDSENICRAYAAADSRIRFINNKNQGVSAARNAGISAAVGEYLMFVDSDDMLYGADVLNKIADKMSGEEDIVSFGWKAVPDGENADNYEPNRCAGLLEGVYENGENYYLKLFQLNESLWYISLYVFKREFWMFHNFKFPEGLFYEDVYLTWRIIIKSAKIRVIPDVIYHYRKNRLGSITTEMNLETEKDKLDVIENNLNYIEKLQEISEELKSLLREKFANLYIDSVFNAAYSKDKRRHKEWISLLKERKYLMKYVGSGKQLVVKYMIKIFGIALTVRILIIRKYIKSII